MSSTKIEEAIYQRWVAYGKPKAFGATLQPVGSPGYRALMYVSTSTAPLVGMASPYRLYDGEGAPQGDLTGTMDEVVDAAVEALGWAADAAVGGADGRE